MVSCFLYECQWVDGSCSTLRVCLIRDCDCNRNRDHFTERGPSFSSLQVPSFFLHSNPMHPLLVVLLLFARQVAGLSMVEDGNESGHQALCSRQHKALFLGLFLCIKKQNCIDLLDESEHDKSPSLLRSDQTRIRVVTCYWFPPSPTLDA